MPMLSDESEQQSSTVYYICVHVWIRYVYNPNSKGYCAPRTPYCSKQCDAVGGRHRGPRLENRNLVLSASERIADPLITASRRLRSQDAESLPVEVTRSWNDQP